MKKYKLINLKTNEEHLCDKITIDGFDYYVNFEWINNLALKENIYIYNSTFKEIGKVISMYGGEFSVESLDKCISGWAIKELCQKVIATNNPNIDIPKVVDEVEELESLAKQTAELKIPLQIFPDAHVERRWFFEGHIDGYNKSQETHPFSEEDMIEFAEWAVRRDRKDISLLFRKSKEELLQLWKEQQPKIVYYVD